MSSGSAKTAGRAPAANIPELMSALHHWEDALNGKIVQQEEAAAHLYPLVVQYEDTDAGAIAYHAAYICYAERARSALLRVAGFPVASTLAEHHQGFVIRNLQAEYHRPAALHDRLVVHTSCTALSAASCSLQQDMFCPENGHIFARVSVQGVWIELDKGPKRFPQHLQQIISSFYTPLS